MRIGVVIPARGERDAVRIDACAMGAALERLGHEVDRFETAPGVPLHRSTACATLLADRAGVLICPFTPDLPVDADLLRRASCHRILRCLANTAVNAADGDERGDLPDFGKVPDCNLYLTDSAATIDRLVAGGAARDRSALLPRFHDAHRLLSVPANADLLGHWQAPSGNWMTVGEPTPAAMSRLLEAFTLYLDRCDARARLIVIRQAGRNRHLDDSVIGAATQSLPIAGHLDIVERADDAALKAAYLSADALVSIGAGIDQRNAMIEASALGTPLVAGAAAAITAIAGNSALLWAQAEPALFAASVERLRADPVLRDELRRRGFARYDRTLSPVAFEGRLAVLMERFA